jgi:hypothetical protein
MFGLLDNRQFNSNPWFRYGKLFADCPESKKTSEQQTKLLLP